MTTKEKMFNDNIGLVHKVINDNFACFKKGEFYGDLFNEGCVALLRSIDKFDASKGFKFSTFACKNIYFTISLYINTKIYQKKKTCNIDLISLIVYNLYYEIYFVLVFIA